MRWVNPRLPVVAAIAFAVGIFAFYELLFARFYVAAIAAALLAVVLLFGIIKRNGVWKIATVAIVFALAGAGGATLCYRSTVANEVYPKQVVLTGRITDLRFNGDDVPYVFYLEDCADEEGNKYDGKVRTLFSGGSYLNVGDIVTATGFVSSVYPVKGEVNTFELRNKVRYELNDSRLLNVGGGKMKADETIRKYIYDVTFNYMPDSNGLLYALLTGDRNAVTDNEQWAFGRAGIVHLLAVSGLHVGFIASLFGLLLRRFRLRPWIEGLIVIVPLLGYAYICGFSPSVTRAVVMLVCGYICKTMCGRYDMLSSTAWAALTVLAIRPFDLFDYGFQLSFMSVIGIAALYIPLERFLVAKNVKPIWRRVIATFAVSACCVAATLFVIVLHGGEIALFGVLVNIIAIPIVSVAFVLGIFGLLPWVFHWLLFASGGLLRFVTLCAETVASSPFAAVKFDVTVWAVFLLIALMFVAGGFVRLTKLGKKIFYPVCCALLVLSIAGAYFPKTCDNRAFVFSTEGDFVVAAMSDKGEAAIVSDFSDYYAVSDAADRFKNYNAEVTLYITHLSRANCNAVKAVVKRCNVVKAYVQNSEANDSVTRWLAEAGIPVVRQYPNSETGNGVKVRSVFDADLAAVTVEFGSANICIAYGDARRVADVFEMGLGADIYLLPEVGEAVENRLAVTVTSLQYAIESNYGANKYGNFTIIQKDDTIKLSFS